jgi:hypothetical protein
MLFQRDVVTHPRDADTGSLQFGPKLGFLPVHVIPDGTARQGAYACANQRVLTALYRIVARHQARYGASRGSDERAFGRLAGLRLPGIRVQCLAATEKRGNAREYE